MRSVGQAWGVERGRRCYQPTDTPPPWLTVRCCLGQAWGGSSGRGTQPGAGSRQRWSTRSTTPQGRENPAAIAGSFFHGDIDVLLCIYRYIKVKLLVVLIYLQQICSRCCSTILIIRIQCVSWCHEDFPINAKIFTKIILYTVYCPFLDRISDDDFSLHSDVSDYLKSWLWLWN